jgi:hypothetical protein
MVAMNAGALIRHVSQREQGWLPRPAVAAIVIVNFAFVIATITAFAQFGSVQTALGYWLRGETLFVDAKEKSLGVVAPGETVTASFKLTNGARNSIRILGCASGCTCVAPKDLPFALRASESREFTVTVHVPTEQQIKNVKSTDLGLRLTLFTSSPAQSRVPLTIRGKVRVGLGAESGPG